MYRSAAVNITIHCCRVEKLDPTNVDHHHHHRRVTANTVAKQAGLLREATSPVISIGWCMSVCSALYLYPKLWHPKFATTVGASLMKARVALVLAMTWWHDIQPKRSNALPVSNPATWISYRVNRFVIQMYRILICPTTPYQYHCFLPIMGLTCRRSASTNPNAVCGFRFKSSNNYIEDDRCGKSSSSKSSKSSKDIAGYELVTYATRDDAINDGAHVTYYGACGYCSSAPNLAAYLDRDKSLVDSAVSTAIVSFAEAPSDFQQNHPALYEEMVGAWRRVYADDCGF